MHLYIINDCYLLDTNFFLFLFFYFLFFFGFLIKKSFDEYLLKYLNFQTQGIRLITHLQYTSWPDHGTPNPVELLEYYSYVSRAMEQNPKHKLLVHCRFDFIQIPINKRIASNSTFVLTCVIKEIICVNLRYDRAKAFI